MRDSQGTHYFHQQPFSKMEEFSILNAIRKFCRVLDKSICPEPKGITIITEAPISEELQAKLGLTPLD